MGVAKDEWESQPSASGGHSADAGEIGKLMHRICWWRRVTGRVSGWGGVGWGWVGVAVEPALS